MIDTATRQTALSVATGAGHHEIVFSEDSRHAFVSNRDAGSVTVLDSASLKPCAPSPPGAVILGLK